MRYAFQQLVEARADVDHMSDLTLAQVIGASQRSVARWRTDGFTPSAADLAATRLGLHPLLVWPNWTMKENE